MALPEMKPIPSSSNIAAVGHDGTDLFVQFKPRAGEPDGTGKVYRYPGADAAHVEAMLKHTSPGGYFHTTVRGAHKGEPVL